MTSFYSKVSERDRSILGLYDAWREMSQKQEIGPGVRPLIAESWRRCLSKNVAITTKSIAVRRDGKDLDKKLLDHKDLLEVAGSVLERMYQYVDRSAFFVSLADAEGIVLSVQGDEDAFCEMYNRLSTPGADWSEESMGTNATGVCLHVEKPVQVFSAEHFAKAFHEWTDSAAPIRDPIMGKTIGVLCVTGLQEMVHPHNLGMVDMAVSLIEQKLKEYQNRIMGERYGFSIDACHHAVLRVRPNGTIAFSNLRGLKELGISSGGLEQVKHVSQIPQLRDVFARSALGEMVSGEDLVLMTQGSMSNVTIIPVSYGNVLTGYVVVGRNNVNPPKSAGIKKPLSDNKEKNVKGFDQIITRSAELDSVIRMAKIAATNDSNVLLLGECGTGKELFARAIHTESLRCDGPLVAVNCGAIPRDLIASELFGYTEGSFTGALRKGKKGKFELASGGTLFLDEVGEMPIDLQVVLLRVLEEKAVYPVGAEEGIPVNCKIIAATNQNLFEKVENGTFRADLFYRLNVFTLQIPPLRERKNDILYLVDYFLGQFGRNIFELSSDVRELFLQYPWPGNLRQLKNTVERLVYVSNDSSITVEMLPPDIQSYFEHHKSSVLPEQKNPQDKEMVLHALRTSRFNYTDAAEMLNISRSTLYRKLKKYGIL